MIANYHTHTWRCKHASGTEREYVERAIRGGLKILGFSDHAPMPFPAGYSSGVRMDMGQLADYVDTILKLKEEYRDDIEIHIGLETEYLPALFETFQEFIRQYPIEYLLLGQHFLGTETEGIYTGRPTDDPQRLIQYCERCMEAFDTGCFTYLAHPDLICFTGERRLYEEWMGKLCLRARDADIPLEINLLGLADHRHYPREEFWRIAGEVGNRVVLGSDAHQADMVWNPSVILKAEKMVGKYHLKLADTVELADPRR